ncbi:MAG: response regulator [Lentisphaeria bacterium]|nr:response regulator [Lentisphaeria bacterium]
MRNLTHRQLTYGICLAAYLLGALLLGHFLRSRLSVAGQLPPLLNNLQTGWKQELLLAQSALDAQRAGRSDKREAALERLRKVQASQDEILRQRVVLREADWKLMTRLEEIDSGIRISLRPITESREVPKRLEEIWELLNQAEALIEEGTASLQTYTILCGIFGWLWPMPLLVLGAYIIYNMYMEKEQQKRTIGNYLSLPTDQLLEGHEISTRRAGAKDDPFFIEGIEEILRRVRQESHSRENFIATMSHEIRTPMNGLLGFLSNLKETQLNDQQKQYLRIIESSAKGLTHVINEILDFTKLRAGKLAPSEVTFDLRSFAEERVALAKQSARGKQVKVQLLFNGEDAVLLRTDPSMLRQILDNLLGNAVKFTERGSVSLEIAVNSEGDALKVDFCVRDSGIGMTQHEQSLLFKPYNQADISIARRYGGTGLGLTISHSLVELLGGNLQVRSNPGEGSAFFFTLKCAASKPEEQVHLSDLYHVKLPRTELKKHWALLVDDTLTNLFLLETICQSVGLPYRTAENGREALELCKQQHFDLIFMDIQMPIMDGYTAIREIRKLPDSATTAIIALTASAYQKDVEKALGAGSTGFIPKPFERDQLLLCIADALDITPERELREEERELSESPEAATVRRMHDFMREQYQLSLGEIKMLLAQTLTDWRPMLDNLLGYAQQGNAQETLTLLHRLKGQLAAIGLLEHSEQTVAMMDAFRENRREDGQTMILGFIQSLTRIFKLLENDVTLN